MLLLNWEAESFCERVLELSLSVLQSLACVKVILGHAGASCMVLCLPASIWALGLQMLDL